jgi:hypothetical protein
VAVSGKEREVEREGEVEKRRKLRKEGRKLIVFQIQIRRRPRNAKRDSEHSTCTQVHSTV